MELGEYPSWGSPGQQPGGLPFLGIFSLSLLCWGRGSSESLGEECGE